jgi:hypothetical protein
VLTQNADLVNVDKMVASVQNFLHENLKLVYLEWIDAIQDSDTDWLNEELTDEFFERDDNVVRESGFIWSEDEDYLYLVGKYMPGLSRTLSSNRSKIPKKWIINRIDFEYDPNFDPKEKLDEENS